MADIGFTARGAGPQAGPSLSLLFSYGGYLLVMVKFSTPHAEVVPTLLASPL